MKRQRTIHPEIIPGKSVTRLHLTSEPGTYAADIHVAHHPNGDLNEDAQWYNIYENPTQFEINLIRKELGIDEEDWDIVEKTLGSFRWVRYHHPVPPMRSSIYVDEQAARTGEWTTAYF